jgi:L-threonylcarbamoyladenylate synthase
MFPSNWQLHNAARVISDGGVIACPSESVFGLSCDPSRRSAVTRLLALKNRPAAKGLIVIASELGQLEDWLQPLTDLQREKLLRSWPGPVTWLLPATASCPPWVRGRHSSLAVRVTAHPVLQRLCTLLDGPVVSTSANRSGQHPARSALEVRLRFGNRIDCILPGQLGKRQRPTEIRDLLTDRLIRE